MALGYGGSSVKRPAMEERHQAFDTEPTIDAPALMSSLRLFAHLPRRGGKIRNRSKGLST
jgi:hypothetical protein